MAADLPLAQSHPLSSLAPATPRLIVTANIALFLVGVVVLTMPVFAIVSRGRAGDPDVATRPTTVVLGRWIRDWVMSLIASGISPDALNVLGAVFGLAAGVAYLRASTALAGWFILLGGLADILDGRVARARGLASRYGEFLDSMLDRFAEVFTFVGLAAYLSVTPVGALAVTLAVGSSLLVSYARAKGDAVGVACRGGVMQRAERLVLLALASIFDRSVASAAGWADGTLIFATVWIIGTGALGTALYRTVAIARALRIRKQD
jgi:CDP-diacylglycerol--glycerol-3-phosphate 3-phosphatidyltransferase